MEKVESSIISGNFLRLSILSIEPKRQQTTKEILDPGIQSDYCVNFTGIFFTVFFFIFLFFKLPFIILLFLLIGNGNNGNNNDLVTLSF